MKIFSFNVRGLCYKKQQIIDLFNRNNIDIFCLQESHLLNLKDLQIIEQKTNSKIFYNSDNNKHGTCIMIKNSPHFQSIQQENSNILNFKNRMTHLIFKTNINIHLINIYAPVSAANSTLERKEFFQNLHKYLGKFTKDEIILCE
ncbi:MAG: endonuclease/exonuclease/phosphatase family protein, partial [Candidatus Thiodiazotropha taylori]